jgi:hypothetical protein
MVRRLVIMGSGETTPGMLGVHRQVFAGLPEPTSAVLLDSPFAFQENADELVERIGAYFAESVGRPLRRVHLPAQADDLALERALADVRSADWVFAGPGSPSYARRCWAGTPIPAALADVVSGRRPGALVLASAAAVTLGDWALPVYEVYKVGEDPRWEPGIGLMSTVLGWRCSVVPHYDNQEGGTHDTRFCWFGARRLERIEPDLGDGFILGVDEHTALVLDLETGSAQVSGRGGVTLRVAGVEDVLDSGTVLELAELEQRVARLGAPDAVAGTGGVSPGGAWHGGPASQAGAAAGQDPAEDARPAVDRGQGTGVEGDAQSDSVDALARRVLAALPDGAAGARSAVVALAGLAQAAAAAHGRDLADQLVAELVDVRARARTAGDWASSDRLRDVLSAVGVEVRDSREGSTWEWR